MEQNLKKFEILNFNENLEKAIKKYTLEVDDAIEAHGFKASSCIDYAEDTILELKNLLKQNYNENNSSNILFKNLENYLDETTSNIVSHTKEDTISRFCNVSNQNLEERLEQLNSTLQILNSRFYNSLTNFNQL